MCHNAKIKAWDMLFINVYGEQYFMPSLVAAGYLGQPDPTTLSWFQDVCERSLPLWPPFAFNKSSDFGVFVTLNFIFQVYQTKVFFEALQKLPMKENGSYQKQGQRL